MVARYAIFISHSEASRRAVPTRLHRGARVRLNRAGGAVVKRAKSMSRLLLLSILVLWMCPRDNVADPHWGSAGVRAGVFLGVYAGLVGVMAVWSRLLARRVGGEYLGK